VKQLVFAIAVLGTLTACDDGDVREHTYLELTCSGILENDHGKYKCFRGTNSEEVEQVDIGTLTSHRTVTVNRRTGSVAFDGRLVGKCSVADFDAWECVERSEPHQPTGLVDYDSLWFRSGRNGGGYLEEWCAVKPGAPAVHNSESCKSQQRYYGVPITDVPTRLRFFLQDQFCWTNSPAFCKYL
jgi:hypothetical protein